MPPDSCVINLRHYLDEAGELPDGLPVPAVTLTLYFGAIVAWPLLKVPRWPLSACRHHRRRTGKNPDGTAREGYCPGWYVRIRKGKRETIRYGGPDRATALEVLDRMQREAARLEFLDEFPSTRATFAEFAEEYLKHSDQRHTEATHATRRTRIQNILVPAFGPQKVAEVRTPHIQRFIATRTSCGPATRNRLLVVLSSLFQRAVGLRMIEADPVRGIRREREHVIPIPLVSLQDQDRLIRSLEEPCRPLFLLALETGIRIGEVLRLEWGDDSPLEVAVKEREELVACGCGRSPWGDRERRRRRRRPGPLLLALQGGGRPRAPQG